jgi:tetratricopeptide (TPR) repeat protein
MDSTTKDAARLTVAMIVRNCAEELTATIASVRAIADEIVVLDTGSTDDTLLAASQPKVAAHRRSWDDDFSAARNACLGRTTGDWILWLDAGETLEPEAAAELRAFVETANPELAYELNVTLPSAPGQLGSEQIARVRLHPRREGLRFAGRVRERLDESLAALEMHIESLPIVIHRGAADFDVAVKTNKAQRNIRLADLELAEHGPSAARHNVLGEAFQSLADHVRAAQHYRRALDLAERGSRDHLESLYGLLTCLDGVTSDRSDQLSLCMLALEHFPLDAQLLVALGGYLQALGQTELAVRSFDLAFRHGQIEPRIWHLPDIRQIAASCAATVLMQAREDEQARTLLEAAVTIYPQSTRLALQLVDLHVRNRRRSEALSVVAGFASPADRERLSAAVRGACLAQQDNWEEAADLLQAAVLDGCRERFCLRWLVNSWLALDRPLDAQSSLRVWLAIEPASEEAAGFQERVTAAIEQQQLATKRIEPIRIDGSTSPLAPTLRPASSTPAPTPSRSR